MKKVLYVEDSATSQLLMRKYLNAACELTITASPKAARDVLSATSFDLIITDFMFPDTDATELIVTLRKTTTPQSLPIIVVSGSMDLTLLSRMLKAGANDGMAKPLNTVDFRAMVERMLVEPYIRTLERSITSVNCLQWAAKGVYFEYCPELDLKVSAETKEEVARLMVSALQEHATRKLPLGFTTHERVVTHTVQG
ncbi:PleD family two-component system response regulator [Nibricoccus sp. IMCC34717]|uniref:response regulator n=1 Tax=Nibricoccus sp. IMCC34717 TaxID=3034021 RepID=UPI00384BA70B